ncbi:uncharacterized protein LOC135499770 [Lineus longissimus]|uniref:uncharacterized protein LOC135499770 n=1 Tax=Lineus longissimus TaxID=88925 RepID=UPI002B4EFD97
MAETSLILDLHAELMTYIKGELDPEKLEELKEVVKNKRKVTRFDISKCDTFEKVWEKLMSSMAIQHGQYNFLKEVLEQIDMREVIPRINHIENQISNIRNSPVAMEQL